MVKKDVDDDDQDVGFEVGGGVDKLRSILEGTPPLPWLVTHRDGIG
jgi:hypothetical protein